jgi:hypothetical protein
MQVLPALINAAVGIYTGNPMAALSSLPKILKLLQGLQGNTENTQSGTGLQPKTPFNWV